MSEDQDYKKLREDVDAIMKDIQYIKDRLSIDANVNVSDVNDTNPGQSSNQNSNQSSNNELVLAQANELIVAAGKKIAHDVYSKVVNHINTEISPKVNSLLEYIEITTEDTSESVDKYRRGVENKERSRIAGRIGASDAQMENRPTYISQYVSLGLTPK